MSRDLGRSAVRSFLWACLGIAVIGILAAVILDNAVQEPVSVAFATSGVRL